MPRLHLFEFGDQPWLPSVFRRSLVEFLAFGANLSDKPYRELAQRLGAALRATGSRELHDVCAGAGGPLPSLARLLRAQPELGDLRLRVSDLSPQPELWQRLAAELEPVAIERTPIDATRVPESATGFRFLCNAFHHFPPELARRVLADARAQRRGIAVVELTSRTPASILATAFAPLSFALFVPFIRPLRASRWFWTYLVPVLPLLALWDGIVSCLRVYDVRELRALAEPLASPDYTFEIERFVPRDGPPLPITLLIGRPQPPSTA